MLGTPSFAEDHMLRTGCLPLLLHLRVLATADASKSLCEPYHTTPEGLDYGPQYHIMGTINSLAHQWPDQSCCVNDVNGIFTHNGVHHVMHQHGFLSIANCRCHSGC